MSGSAKIDVQPFEIDVQPFEIDVPGACRSQIDGTISSVDSGMEGGAAVCRALAINYRLGGTHCVRFR